MTVLHLYRHAMVPQYSKTTKSSSLHGCKLEITFVILSSQKTLLASFSQVPKSFGHFKQKELRGGVEINCLS